jgi:hypothetical protein
MSPARWSTRAAGVEALPLRTHHTQHENRMSQTNDPIDVPIDESEAWRAVADWYRAYFIGIVLSTVARRSSARAAELVYHLFSHQRTERFLPGLRKLGIDQLPHAVAAAQYHYLSNDIGGVPVQYMYESDRKAWIRYPVPRWAWTGTALCGIPTEVSRAMLAGWHAQNGVSLGNPRLGFVCTKQAADGQSGLEGYYYEYDRDLSPEERLRFARNEDAPDFDPAAAPRLPTTAWPQSRLAKAHRNYAMEYIRTALPVAVNLWGPQEAIDLLGLTGRLIGMQFYHETASRLGLNAPDPAHAAGRSADTSAAAFGDFMSRLINAQGDSCEVQRNGDQVRVFQKGWTLMDDLAQPHPSIATAFNGLLEGALSAHNHRLTLHTSVHRNQGRFEFEWLIHTARSSQST